MTANYPILPPFCVVKPAEEYCTFLGIKVDCFKGLDLDGPFGTNLEYGHIFTFVFLTIIGVWNIMYARFPWDMRDSMKLTTGYYAIVTGIFALCRLGWGISRPLLMGAAAHNLAEWIIFFHIAGFVTSTYQLRIWIGLSTFFILTIVVLVEMVPILLGQIAVEQFTGIIADFLLWILFTGKWYLSKKSNPEASKFYTFPALATTLHLWLTIVPLVYANFFVYQTSWLTLIMEGAVYISAPITHILYFYWSFEVDKFHWPEPPTNPASPAWVHMQAPKEKETKGAKDKKGEDGGKKEAPKAGGAAAAPSPSKAAPASASSSGNGQLDSFDDVIPANLRITANDAKGIGLLIFLVLVSAGLAFLTLRYVPLHVMGFCKETPCHLTTAVYYNAEALVHPGFGPSFENLAESLIKGTLIAPGNLDFLVSKSNSRANTYLITSKWSSEPDLMAWKNGLLKQVMTPALKGLLVSGDLSNDDVNKEIGWPNCRSPVDFGAFSATLGSSCANVWKVVSNWSDCSWISNCLYVVVDPSLKRAIHTADGRLATNETLRSAVEKDHTLVYEGTEIPGYVATVTLTDSKDGAECEFRYSFSIKRNPNVLAYIYKDLYANRIPHLKQRFAK